MCQNRIWQPILEEDCPNICGFCEKSKCRDIAPYCAQHITICRHQEMEAFARVNCR
ncbi:hypothetical protein OESDEN_20648 [Oesophagostomum dentatum]|uniref:ShKT domain-containing protein n=1 Tax=Oesophagostomum dentatum TaxID=61180 RepID=A0A0B1S868_OESDE|nr:hypothetical protein OESDEN_20648 [Oesophagostomum dentatum]